MSEPAVPSDRAILGLDFGTTNSVAAIARNGESELVQLDAPDGPEPTFRSALCFWQDEHVEVEAGPWAIAEFLDFPDSSRFLQSFKSVAASPTFEQTTIFERRYRFEQLGKLFLQKMAARAHGALSGAQRVIVGRPVVYAGSTPSEALARERYDKMFEGLSPEIHYVYEPMGAAFSYASRISDPATILVADFGGGTSDFSVVRIEAPGAAHRCKPLGHAGVGIAGDRFDGRIIEHMLLPLLGKGGTYNSFGKTLEIPPGYFSDVADWSRLAMMRNRKMLAELHALQRAANDPNAIGRLIAIVEDEQGFPLHEAVSRTKRALSSATHAEFRFNGAGLKLHAEVSRADFERWIAPDISEIEAAVDRALTIARTLPGAIDRVFLTGGTSLVPRVRHLFEARFGADRIATGGELTSIAHGLALIGEQPDIAAWTA